MGLKRLRPWQLRSRGTPDDQASQAQRHQRHHHQCRPYRRVLQDRNRPRHHRCPHFLPARRSRRMSRHHHHRRRRSLPIHRTHQRHPLSLLSRMPRRYLHRDLGPDQYLARVRVRSSTRSHRSVRRNHGPRYRPTPHRRHRRRDRPRYTRHFRHSHRSSHQIQTRRANLQGRLTVRAAAATEVVCGQSRAIHSYHRSRSNSMAPIPGLRKHEAPLGLVRRRAHS